MIGIAKYKLNLCEKCNEMVLRIYDLHTAEINFRCTSSSPLPETGDGRKHNETESNGCASIVGKQVAFVTVASHE